VALSIRKSWQSLRRQAAVAHGDLDLEIEDYKVLFCHKKSSYPFPVRQLLSVTKEHIIVQ
jgi:hypothetical protein